MSVPSNLRIPLVFLEFNSERAFQGPSLKVLKTVLIGQKTTAGTLAQNTLRKVTSADEVKGLAGVGSVLHIMAISFFAANKITPCYIVAQDDNGAGVLAAGTVAFTGPATAAGTVYIYIGGKRLTVAIASGDANTVVATKVRDAILADTSLQVTASATTGTVTITAKNKGETGLDIDIRTNYLNGETYPAGVGATVTAMSAGAVNPVITAALDALGNEQFDLIACPYVDTANLALVELELDDRWGPTVMTEGHYITARQGTLSNLSTFGGTRNSKHITVMNSQKVPSGPWAMASAVAAQVSLEGTQDPARPLQTLELVGILPPAIAEQFAPLENNSLLFDGISTFFVDAGGKVRIQRIITTYQTSAFGAEDLAYLSLEVKLTLSYLRYDFKARIEKTYPRAKLADDGTRVTSGGPVVTPSSMRAEAISWFRAMEAKGFVENFEQFKKDLVVTRDASNPDRLNLTLPPDVVNQLVVVAGEIAFLLQSP